MQHVCQRSPCIENCAQDPPDAAASGVLDDEAGAGGDVGFEVGVDAAGVAGHDLDAGIVEAPGDRPAFHDEVHVEARQQDLVQGADDEFVLADGENAHVSDPSSGLPLATAGCSCPNRHYTPLGASSGFTRSS